jgi:hypothetical protein
VCNEQPAAVDESQFTVIGLDCDGSQNSIVALSKTMYLHLKFERVVVDLWCADERAIKQISFRRLGRPQQVLGIYYVKRRILCTNVIRSSEATQSRYSICPSFNTEFFPKGPSGTWYLDERVFLIRVAR